MFLSSTILILFEYIYQCMSSSTRRQQQERDGDTSNTQQQHEATIRSIDDTKNNIHQALEEVKRETPRYSQAVTDFQVQTVDATHEIANNFLDSQKEVISSIKSAWTPVVQRITNNNI